MTTVTYLDGEVDMDLPDWLPPRGPDGMWGLEEIGKAAGATKAAAFKWRNNYNNDVAAGRPLRPASLPKEDDTVWPYGHRYGFPRWKPERIIRWLQQTGRMDADLHPVKLKHRSGGVPGHRTQGHDETGRFKKTDD